MSPEDGRLIDADRTKSKLIPIAAIRGQSRKFLRDMGKPREQKRRKRGVG